MDYRHRHRLTSAVLVAITCLISQGTIAWPAAVQDQQDSVQAQENNPNTQPPNPGQIDVPPEAILATTSDKTIIRGGWLFDGVSDDVVPNTGIVVHNGSFFEVGADLTDRDLAEYKVIELGDDDYVLPGLFDLHAHYNVTLAGRPRQDEKNVMPILYLANGWTSTFPAGEYDPDGMMAMRKRIDRGQQIGPRVYNSGPYFGTARRGWSRRMTAEEIYEEVDYWVINGARGFKAKGIAPEHLQPLIERAHWHGLTVTGHLDSGFRNSVNPKTAILMGIDRVEHFLGGDVLPDTQSAYRTLQDLDPNDPGLNEIIQLYIDHGVYFDATIATYGSLGELGEGFEYWTDEQKYFTPFVNEWLANKEPRRSMEMYYKIYLVKKQTIKRYFDAGGKITIGSDHPSTGTFISGFFGHREVAHLVMCGLPPAAALKAATANGANAMNVGQKLGTVEAGKFADLCIIRGNPLEDIHNTHNVRLVMKAGELYDSAKLLECVEGKLGPKGDDDWQ